MLKENKDRLRGIIHQEAVLQKKWLDCTAAFEAIMKEVDENNLEFRRWWITCVGDGEQMLVEIDKKLFRLKKPEKITFDDNHCPVGVYIENLSVLKV